MNLITGATGLIGAHVALQLLQQNKPVTAIKREGSDVSKTKQLFSYYVPNAEELFDKIKWIDADITDIYSVLDALNGIETVYHCAGFVSFDNKDRDRLHAINAIGTANVANACLEKKIQILCHVSSIATLQNPDITKNIDESVYWKSSPEASDYAISKYNGEREVWRAMEEGLKALIVNPGLVIGPGFWNQSSGKLVSTCYNGTPFYTNGSSAAISAWDTTACMLALVEKKEFNKRFVLTSANYTFKELLSLFHKAFDKKEPYMEAGKVLLTLGMWFDSLRCAITGNEQLITKATVHAGLARNTFNNALIKKTLQYEFAPLSETVRFVCDAYLKEKKHA
ncbi:MAG: NAD-dependent epimerase/dehydratase family protein [Bacteroidota bacterium]